MSTGAKAPLRVAVTGAAGAIGYATVFRIASGQMLGADQPVILQLLELPGAPRNALDGVKMEIDDCAFPTCAGVVCTDDPNVAFGDADYAMLIGSKPRGPGMERADLLRDNGAIFTATGKALNDNARKSVRVCVVGNPANTNCLIAAANAPDIPTENFSAMMRLDHNRAVGQLAVKSGSTSSAAVEKMAIWGNHSANQYPDSTRATINGQLASEVINDAAWFTDDFIPTVQKRGAAIIAARGASSAASAGNASMDHIRDWFLGSNGQWVSMAFASDGTYGVPKDIFFSLPVICKGNHVIEKVTGLEWSEYDAAMIDKSVKELLEERDAVKHLL